jgi:hypothetical protein
VVGVWVGNTQQARADLHWELPAQRLFYWCFNLLLETTMVCIKGD